MYYKFYYIFVDYRTQYGIQIVTFTFFTHLYLFGITRCFARKYGTPFVSKLKTSFRYVPGMEVTSPYVTKIRNK